MKIVDNCDLVRNRDVFPSPDGAIRDRHSPRFAWNEHELIRVGRLVRSLHGLGVRPLYEFLREIVGRDSMLAVDIEQQLQRYAQLDPETVAALDGRDLQLPLVVVEASGSIDGVRR